MTFDDDIGIPRLLEKIACYFEIASLPRPNLGRVDSGDYDQLQSLPGIAQPRSLLDLYGSFGDQPDNTGIFLGLWLTPLGRSISQLLTNQQHQIFQCSRSIPSGYIKQYPRDLAAIAEDHDAQRLFVDLDPDVSGRSGQIIARGRFDETWYVVSESLEALLQLIITKLENGEARPYRSKYSSGVELREYPGVDLVAAIVPFLEIDDRAASLRPERSNEWYNIYLRALDGWKPTAERLSRVTEFDRGLFVTDLDPLRNFVNLEVLFLQDQPKGSTTDWTAISGLEKLRILGLSGSSIQDLSALRGLRDLESLDLSSTKLETLRPLSSLEHLHTLSLRNARLADTASLAAPTSVRDLTLSGCAALDLKPLDDLASLRKVTLSSRQLPYLDQSIPHRFKVEVEK